MLGTIVNALAILAGGGLGLLLRGTSPERFRVTIMQGLALAVLLIGIQGALKTNDLMCVIASLVLGGLLGEALRIESRLESLGESARGLFERIASRGSSKPASLNRSGGSSSIPSSASAIPLSNSSSGSSTFAEGFLTASLVYCVGAMAIIGSLEDGLTGAHATLFAKASLDGVSAVFFASTLGPGVLLSALPVVVYQGAITLLAHLLSPLLTAQVMDEMSAVGGLLIIGISINLFGIAKVKVGNMLPAALLPMAYLPIISIFSR
ncbi:membrane protein [Clostridia bacterium]|nr:membrane protein [Clostridia bacterium]